MKGISPSMIEKISAVYPKGNGIVRQVKRAKNTVKMEKQNAAKIDLGLGTAAGALTYLMCRAMEIYPIFGPILAVILTPIVGKHLGDRYKNVEEAKNEYMELKNTPEYERVLKRHDYMQKRRMLRK